MSDKGLTFADACGYVVVFLCGSDGEFTDDETQAAIAILAELMVAFDADQDGDGDVDHDDLKKSWTAACDTFFNAESGEERVEWLIACSVFLGKCLGEDNNEVFTSRLRGLIAADGHVSEQEDRAVNFVDELIIFTAGVIIGGDGLPTVASLGLDNLKDARRLNLLETMTIDGDVMTRWSFK